MAAARTLLLLCACSCFLPAGALPATCRGADVTLEMVVSGERIEGRPLSWSSTEILLLGRDGQLWNFPPEAANHYRKVSNRFDSFTVPEMRSMLQAEFGRGFQVTGTGHYLVVHPAGQRDLWAPRFEDIYRSFNHYFTIRGWRTPSPAFPLVAVVFPTRDEFIRYANQTEVDIGGDVLGYYSPKSNRILMYDVAARNPDAWSVNAETIIHEAAHQVAFNTGIHHRYHAPPRWLCEGLGTMFEAPGVWNPRNFSQQKDRVNFYRLERFASYQNRRPRGFLVEMLASDEVFDRNPDIAYAESWAFSFFLAETRPKQYIEYLRRTAQAPPPGAYDARERRLRDFVAIFGNNLTLLETHYLRFMETWTSHLVAQRQP